MRKIFNHISERSSVGIVLFALLAVLILSASVHSAWAYFTTYATARGGYTIEHKTRINEKFSEWKKHVSISNDKDSGPVYVRAKGFCGSAYTLNYGESSNKWSLNEKDGYYYYSDILFGGGNTEELVVEIGNIPENIANSPDFDPADFNVVIIYETIPVLYDVSGKNALPADWSGEVDVTTETVNN